MSEGSPQRLLIRVAKRKRGREDRAALRAAINYALSATGAAVRDLRIASTALELDVLATEKAEMKLVEETISKSLGDIISVRNLSGELPRAMDREQMVKAVLELFNDERFWEVHELLEVAWREARGREKVLLQGIILVAGALVHHQKYQDDICLSMLERASSKLAWEERYYHGLDLFGLRASIGRMLETKAVSAFKINLPA